MERALDFAAVTDHGALLAETALCTRSGSASYDSAACVNYRGERPAQPLVRRLRMLAAFLGER